MSALERFKLKRSRLASESGSPSPRPSPAGRGRNAPRLLVQRRRSSAWCLPNFKQPDSGCSLSQRERVRVREKTADNSTCGHSIFENALIPTGLRPSAQGCPQRTTLGQSAPKIFNPNGAGSIRRHRGVQPIRKSLQNSPGAPASCRRVVVSSMIRRLEASAPSGTKFCRGLFQGCDRFDIKPKVARCAQPWADGWNPVGIRTAQRAVPTCAKVV